MASIPIDIWHQVFNSLYETHDLESLSNLSQASTSFCAIGQPLLFRKLSGHQLQKDQKPDDVLFGPNGVLLRSWIRDVEVELLLEMVPMCEELEWSREECDDACQRMSEQWARAWQILNTCSGITYMDFVFVFEDSREQKDLVQPQDFLQLPSLPKSDLLSLCCMPTLRHLGISCDNDTYFDFTAFGHLIAAALQLKSLKLGNIYDANLFVPLLQRLSSNQESALSTCSLIELDCNALSHDGYTSHLRTLPSIRLLRIQGYRVLLELAASQAKVRPITSVIRLHLSRSLDFDSRDLSPIASHFPELQLLQVRDAYSVSSTRQEETFSALDQLHFRHLQVLSLDLVLYGSPDEHLALVTSTCAHIEEACKYLTSARLPSLRRFHLDLQLVSETSKTAIDAYCLAVEYAVRFLPVEVEAELFVTRGLWSDEESREKLWIKARGQHSLIAA